MNNESLNVKTNNFNFDDDINSPSTISTLSSNYSPVYIRRAGERKEITVTDIESNMSDLICNICDEDIKDLCALRCGHIICLQCFLNWFKNNKSCPFCRTGINIEIYLNEEYVSNERLSNQVRLLHEENTRLLSDYRDLEYELQNPSICNIQTGVPVIVLIGLLAGFIYYIS